MKLRLIELEYPDEPYMNLAMDEAIFIEVVKGNSPPTVRFYRNANTVVLGCFQLAEEEVNINYVIHNDIKIAKRLTGGGASYCDMGSLNYSIVSRELPDSTGKTNDLISTMMNGAATAFREMGLEPKKDALNSISINENRVMESYATMRRGAFIFNGLVSVNTDNGIRRSVLRPKGKAGTESVYANKFMTNLNGICEKGIGDVRKTILDCYSREMGFEYENGALTKREDVLLERLYKEKYRRSEWNLGRVPVRMDY